jgi:hypothetical protein
VRVKITLFCFCVALLAQGPPPESYRLGKLVAIDARVEVPRYEYTVWNGVDDAFTGASPSPIGVQLNHKVKYAIKGRSLYIIDESGKSYETNYFKQEEMVPTSVYRRHLPRWWWRVFRKG